ncbi:hypothetical protein [Methylobacterium gnaphalii]|uniref:Uncharacterized protein n=1 Tax=Methylobacterium gnaphalii TaxID=1010610 RepID=A0A512JQP3_9HYPH|nr:hypothetical protein [Methylobacterium gnaphalii]GEP12285.1 hypothetical protein MGN01_41300 [Methylobacterium gnaphalii]GJD68711.1 hypothetical protein MMMDOFMJ_1635 [Methylobacterium gnaphalii]GLS49392.1 hypothetical protein GCM10007885_22400 [Methylobacterium gnaphalii]
MAAPSKIRAAQSAPDRPRRIALMVRTMIDREAANGACTFGDLSAAGFSEAEIIAYRDPAREQISNRGAIDLCPPGRREGHKLVKAAKLVRKRLERRQAPQAQRQA